MILKIFYELLIREIILSWSHHKEVFSFWNRQQLSKFTKENESSNSEQKESCEGKPREDMSLPRREIFPKDESKYATILAANRENRRSKFEELQAASKNLERRLHEDDDRRRQEMERRINKDKPPRCDKFSALFLFLYFHRAF